MEKEDKSVPFKSYDQVYEASGHNAFAKKVLDHLKQTPACRPPSRYLIESPTLGRLFWDLEIKTTVQVLWLRAKGTPYHAGLGIVGERTEFFDEAKLKYLNVPVLLQKLLQHYGRALRFESFVGAAASGLKWEPDYKCVRVDDYLMVCLLEDGQALLRYNMDGPRVGISLDKVTVDWKAGNAVAAYIEQEKKKRCKIIVSSSEQALPEPCPRAKRFESFMGDAASDLLWEPDYKCARVDDIVLVHLLNDEKATVSFWIHGDGVSIGLECTTSYWMVASAVADYIDRRRKQQTA